jgi:BirA family biotin operon repressor/biotin-[acetyl-CoA-carboxylase] ligase
VEPAGPEAEVRQALAARGVAWPAPIHFFPVLGSTNAWLLDAARAGAPHGTVAWAGAQTSGRGRRGRSWSSDPGDLFLSVLWRPGLGAGRAGILPLAVGVAVAEAAHDLGVRTWLKWPNDVVARGGKLAGVLLESAWGATGLEAVVAGVGMNLVRETVGDPPRPVASVRGEAGRAPSVTEAAATVLARLALGYDALRAPADVVVAWKARAVPWWGRRVELRGEGGAISGIARDVDAGGGLVLEAVDGSRVVVLSGEVEEVRLEGERS